MAHRLCAIVKPQVCLDTRVAILVCGVDIVFKLNDILARYEVRKRDVELGGVAQTTHTNQRVTIHYAGIVTLGHVVDSVEHTQLVVI